VNYRDVDPLQLRRAEEILYSEGGILEFTVHEVSHLIEVPVTSAFGGESLDNPNTNAGENRRPGLGLSLLRDAMQFPKSKIKKSSGPLFDDLDQDGDTKLIAMLKKWPQHPKSRIELENIIQGSDIHMRDERGYTALAIAARQGVREAVSLLLQQGANPNTRSYQKTSVIAHAATHLAQAEKENNDQMYSKILSCMTLLADNGAKHIATVYDEYSVFIPAPRGQESKTRTIRTKLRKNQRSMSLEPIPEKHIPEKYLSLDSVLQSLGKKDWQRQKSTSSIIAQPSNDFELPLQVNSLPIGEIPIHPLSIQPVELEENMLWLTAGQIESPTDSNLQTLQSCQSVWELDGSDRQRTSDYDRFQTPTAFTHFPSQLSSQTPRNRGGTSGSRSKPPSKRPSPTYDLQCWNLPTMYLGTETGPTLFSMCPTTASQQPTNSEGDVSVPSYARLKDCACDFHQDWRGNRLDPLRDPSDTSREALPTIEASVQTPIPAILRGGPAEIGTNFNTEYGSSKETPENTKKQVWEVNQTVPCPPQHDFNHAIHLTSSTYPQAPVHKPSHPKIIIPEREDECINENCQRLWVSSQPVETNNIASVSFKRRRLESLDEKTGTLCTLHQPARTEKSEFCPVNDSCKLSYLSAGCDRWYYGATQGSSPCEASQSSQLRSTRRKMLRDSYQTANENGRLPFNVENLRERHHPKPRSKIDRGGFQTENTKLPTSSHRLPQFTRSNLTNISNPAAQIPAPPYCSIKDVEGSQHTYSLEKTPFDQVSYRTFDTVISESTPSNVHPIMPLQNGWSTLIDHPRAIPETRASQLSHKSWSPVTTVSYSVPDTTGREMLPHPMMDTMKDSLVGLTPVESSCDFKSHLTDMGSWSIADSQSLTRLNSCSTELNGHYYGTEDLLC
jgi:hypothetical protein